MIRLLRDDHRVVAWDMRGHGRSRAGRDGVTLDAVAEDIATVIAACDLDDVVLVGHSMGGMAMCHFARLHPRLLAHKVRGLAFVATSARVLPPPSWRADVKTLGGVAGALLLAGLRVPSPYRWRHGDLSTAMVAIAFGPDATARMVDDVRVMLSEARPETMVEAGRSISTHDELDHLGSVHTPTEIVVGDYDRLTPPAHAQALHRAIAGSRVTVVERAGHQVMQEAPHELCSVIRSLTGQRGSAA
ncbi:MAG: alpha/beta fold hydrolase [Microthrixaceae bacterium]